MPTSHPPLPLDLGAVAHFTVPAHDHLDAVRRWQARLDGSHESNTFMGALDAGRIGGNPPTPPAVAAQREANDALFRGFARDRARARRSGLA